MAEDIIITKKNGSRVPVECRHTATTIESATQNWGVNGQETVSLTVVSSFFPKSFEIGDVLTLFGRDYRMNRLPIVEKTGFADFKFTLEFEGVQYDLLRATYDLTVDTTTNVLQDVQGDTLTGSLKRFMSVLIANANRVFPGKWRLGSCPDTIGDKTLTFGESDNCLSVLQNLCSKSNFNCEFQIVKENGVYVINLAEKIGQVLPYTFSYGRGNGLYELTRGNVSSANIVTRLKVYGSSENITMKYRADRLCLPGKSKGQSFIEKADAIAKYGVFEGRKDFNEIKPTFTGRITSVIGGNVLQFVDTAFPFDINEKEADGKTTKYLIPGVPAKIHFNTGNLAGYEFEIAKYDHATHTFTVKKITDERGSEFPSASSSAFQFAVGNEYKILDVAYPKSIEEQAEQRLAEEANKYYDQNCQPRVQYGLSVTPEYIEKMVDANSDVVVNPFAPGDYLHIVDDDIEVDKSIRIKSFTRNVLNPYEYQLTVSDLTVTTSIENRLISEATAIDKILSVNNLKDPVRARSNWRSTREVLDMVFDPDGDYYTEKIKPQSIDTMALSVGAKSMQFGLKNTIFQPNYNGNKNVVKVQGGVLTHYTINEDSARSWTLADTQVTLRKNEPYYIYAKCSKSDSTGSIVFLTDQKKTDADPNFYYFGIGIVNSVDPETKVRSISLTYGFTMVNGRFIKTGRIESADGTTYFDLDNSEIGGRIVFSSNGQEKTLEELGAESLETKDYINNTLPGILDEIQTQLDGRIEQFFETYDPDLNNKPASDWTTDKMKETHLGDLFYNTSSGAVFRFVIENGVYKWMPLSDSEAAKALELAQDALNLAKTKNQIFNVQPYTPYQVGDLWVQGGNGDIFRCKNSRKSGAFTSSDWEKASKYTDDSSLNKFIDGLFQDTVNNIINQIDGKVESWFQTTDPNLSWEKADKKKHVGDMWYNPTDNKLLFYVHNNCNAFTALVTNGKCFYKKNYQPNAGNAPEYSWNAQQKEESVGALFFDSLDEKLYRYSKEINPETEEVKYFWYDLDVENIIFVVKVLDSNVGLHDGARIFTTRPSSYAVNDLLITKDEIAIAINGRSTYKVEDWTVTANDFYFWQRSYDQNAIDAYEAASKAQDTADGKRRTFVEQPYPPYDIGDLWVDGKELRRCQIAKAKGELYAVDDWVIAVQYDNTKTVIDGGLVTSGTIQVAGDEHSILAGMTGAGTTADSIRFWAGASFENRASAPYRVMQDGSVVMTKATVEGIIKATSGLIGGFEIAPGRIGVEETPGSYNNNGFTILESLIKFSKVMGGSTTYAAIGTSVLPLSAGYPCLAKFMYEDTSGSANSAVAMALKCRPNVESTWYTQRALEIDGNTYSIGKSAIFDDGYIGQAFTDIVCEYIGITHNFYFKTVATSLLGMDLPTRNDIQKIVDSSKPITFDLILSCDPSMTGTINLRSRYGAQMYDSSGKVVNAVELNNGDALRLRYCDGKYIKVAWNW